MKRVIILLAALVLLAPSLNAQEQQKIDKNNLVIKEWNTDARSNTRGKLVSYKIFEYITHLATYVNDVFYEFFPDSRDALRWDFLLEEMHRFRGGEWKENPYRHTD